ncbi:MAG: proline dehydrogenase family protein [Isosphaeraceae bacterium]
MATTGVEAGQVPGPAAPPTVSSGLDQRARAIGRELFAETGGGPSFRERAWWDDRLMGLTMDDPAVKVQLFRFIDALPTLPNDRSVRRHLDEYLAEADGQVPALLDLPLRLAPSGPLGDRIVANLARTGARQMAGRFIAGSTPAEALVTVQKLRKQRLGFTADLLGEAIISDPESDAYQKTCLDILKGLAGPLNEAPEVPQIDRDDRGPIPRVNLSLKLTSLTPRFDAIHEESTTEAVLERLRPILRTARQLGAFVNIDMEQYAHKDITYAIFRKVLDEPEFRDWPHAGIVCQAYLPEAEGDLQMLVDWARKRGTPVAVRLVKGAYWDYEVLHAGQVDWPIPVYTQKWQSDACYERCSRFLLANHEVLRPALASHNIRSLSHALATAESLGVPQSAFEIQMLYGMGEPIQRALIARGYRLRVYTPYGAMLPGMAYLVRRLLENTSNESFLKASFIDGARVEDLLRDPEEIGSMLARKRVRKEVEKAEELAPFRNEPPTDFTRAENKAAMVRAIAEVKGQLGRHLPMSLAGKWVEVGSDPSRQVRSIDPSETSRTVAILPLADANQAAEAIRFARDRFAEWSLTPARERAQVLLRAAAILRRRKFELAAWEVFECAKPWREADGDLAEAIDFCEFYAREMIRLDQAERRDVPGETNAIESIPMGVAVVIPPWNFPLAIPMGMTVAALVTGNTVILKPAEQSSAIGYFLAKVLEEAGLPAGALQFLPGIGEEIGPTLVNHPEVNLIAFTGSRNVGLLINRQAADTPAGQNHVKHVIAEMGGKNAIIVDDDADLDEAVLGILRSAFGYAGQKCSACSRVIALGGIYDQLVARLAEAAHAWKVGPAEDPDTDLPPLIDADARDRVNRYRELAATEGRVVARIDVGDLAAKGNYAGPLIVADVRPDAKLAQEEIFGPVLSILRADDLSDALRIANGTAYALTGGLFSRSPANIDRVKREFRVGNLYINRTTTGALVDRQPFGGFKLSGVGSHKAGGSDYLKAFLLSRTVTENTMRRGFAPELSGSEATPSGGI